MKTIPFTKMSGAGNDFIVVDAPEIKNLDAVKFTKEACDRSTGIGGDGVLILDSSKKADYKMRIINADGSEAEMCGNGARCMASYIVANKSPKKKLFVMETLAGLVEGEAQGEIANVHLSDPKDYRPDVAVDINGHDMHVSYIDTGVPHTIVYVDELPKINVPKIGPTIRYHKTFKPRGTNVNFAEQIDDSLVHVRTYERGVEDETKACGTGSVASAIVTYLRSHKDEKYKKKAKMNVKTTGGEILEVTFDITNGKATNVWLKGSAKFVAKGEYYL